MKKLWKRFWAAVMVLLISLSVIFSAFGQEQNNARPNQRTREEIEVSAGLGLEEDSEG